MIQNNITQRRNQTDRKNLSLNMIFCFIKSQLEIVLVTIGKYSSMVIDLMTTWNSTVASYLLHQVQRSTVTAIVHKHSSILIDLITNNCTSFNPYNPSGRISVFNVLLCLTPDDFTCQVRDSRRPGLKGLNRHSVQNLQK